MPTYHDAGLYGHAGIALIQINVAVALIT